MIRRIVTSLAAVALAACASPSDDATASEPVAVDVLEPMLETMTSESAPDPSEVSLLEMSYGGTGCPSGSAAATLAPDLTSLAITFNSFNVAGAPVTESRKSCLANVNIHVPAGWSYSVSAEEARGNVNLPAGRADLQSTLYFQGERAQAMTEHTFVSPVAGDYDSGVTLSPPNWMPCGDRSIPLNIIVQLRIMGTHTASAQVSLGVSELKLMWRRC